MKSISKKELLLLIAIFFFFFLLLLFIPITGDDWGNFLIGKNGFWACIENTIMMYRTWEGRIVSRLFINLLTYHRLIYVILTSFLITSFCYCLANLFPTKNKFFLYFSIIIFFLTLENTMWTQSFLWVAGTITYLFPTILIVFYLYFYLHVIQKKESFPWYFYIFSAIFSFLITMFVENIAVGYIVLNIIFLLKEFYEKRKINKFLACSLFFSSIGFILMIISPGSAGRLQTEDQLFYHLSLISKIKSNIPNFIYYTLLTNIPLLMVIGICILLLLKFIERKEIRILLKIMISILWGYILIMCTLKQLGHSILWAFFQQHLLFFFVPFLFVFVLFVYLFMKYLKKEVKLRYLALIVTGISSNAVMIISPVWGGRVAIFTNVLLFISFLYLDLELLKQKKFPRMTRGLGILSMVLFVVYLGMYYHVYEFTKFREKSIREQIQNKENPIIVYTSPNNLLWGNNPGDEYHIKTFKEYYQIPSQTEINLKKNKSFYP